MNERPHETRYKLSPYRLVAICEHIATNLSFLHQVATSLLKLGVLELVISRFATCNKPVDSKF